MTKQDKILSLKKYIETIERQMQQPPARHASRLEEYKAWAKREIKKTQSDIDKLSVL